MIKLGVILFVSLTIMTSLTLAQQYRIPYVRYANPGDLPFDAVYLADSRITCSAVILSSTVAMTAAHCIPVKYKTSSVYAGATQLNGNGGGVRKHIVRTLIHEAYDGTPGNQNNDIALLFLKTDSPFVFDKFIQPAVLPSEYQDYQQSTTQAYVASWGDDRRLKSSLVRLIPRENCLKEIGKIGRNVVCASFEDKKADACEDTAGGALYIGNKVIGLSSFGWACGLTDRPSGYTDIAKVIKWIRRNTRL